MTKARKPSRKSAKPAPALRQCSKCCGNFNPRTLKGAAHLASCRMYNGFVNYETWCVSLWLDNEEGTQNYWREVAAECVEEGKDGSEFLTAKEKARHLLARRLESEVYKDNDDLPSGTMIADMLGAAFEEVRWFDIAEHILAE